MTEAGRPDETPEREQPKVSSSVADNKQPRARRGLLAIVALIVAILALCAAVALWFYASRQTRQMAERVRVLSQAQHTQSDTLQTVRSHLNQMGDLQAQLNRLQSLARDQHDSTQRLNKLESQNDDFKQALAKTQRRMAHLDDLLHTDTRGWALVEIEHLLEAANSRLQLYDDVHGALAALRLAQQRLAQMQDPALFDVRRSVQKEVTQLRAVPQVDIEGKSLTLSTLIQAVPSLPLKRGVPAAFHARQGHGVEKQSNKPGWLLNTWHSIRVALSGMLAIRRTDSPSPALLAPKHEYFLYQNLQLKLEAARLSLLRQDTSAFRTGIATALDWLNTYFKSDAAAVKSARQQLSSLATAELSPALPDISDSLTQVRKRLTALRSDNSAEQYDNQPQGESKSEKPAARKAQKSGENKASQSSQGNKAKPGPAKSKSKSGQAGPAGNQTPGRAGQNPTGGNGAASGGEGANGGKAQEPSSAGGQPSGSAETGKAKPAAGANGTGDQQNKSAPAKGADEGQKAAPAKGEKQ